MSGIYIHIPFCRQACHYCDFHFTTTQYYRSEIIDAMVKEIEKRKNYLPEKKISTIYFGGGTPSLLNEEELSRILNSIHKNLSVEGEIEFTLEANPDDLTSQKLRMLKKIGVNRLSIGVQSFRNEDLKWMNRAHSVEQADNSVRDAAQLGFSNLSIDLIYGLPTSALDHWKKNLEEAIALPIQHLSCYCLTVEEHTALSHFVKKGKVTEKKDEASSTEFLFAHDFLEQNNFRHYEVSNYSIANSESKHNSNYWNNTHYLGIGPSAHSYNGNSRRWNVANNILYLNSVKNNQSFSEEEILTLEQSFNEYLMTRLRTSNGISFSEIENLFGKNSADELKKKILAYKKLNHFIQENGKLILTPEGMLNLNPIVIEWML